MKRILFIALLAMSFGAGWFAHRPRPALTPAIFTFDGNTFVITEDDCAIFDRELDEAEKDQILAAHPKRLWAGRPQRFGP